MPATRRAVLLPLILVACATQPQGPAWAVELAALDPAFGGGGFHARQLETFLAMRVREGRKPSAETGDPAVRAALYARSERAGTQRAIELLQEHLDEATARAALEFFKSEAGRAYVAAQLTALSGLLVHRDTFPAETAEAYGDPARSGAASKEAIFGPGGVGEIVAQDGGSVSPVDLAIKVGSLRVDASFCATIRAFFSSAAGKRYLKAQLAAYPDTATRYQALWTEAVDLGLVDQTEEERQPLTLPIHTGGDGR